MRAVRLPSAIALGLGLALLGACGSTVQETLGVGKRTPDEFQVVRRAPLVLPPDYNLRPPRPGVAGPEQDPATQAQEILTGSPRPRSAAQTPGETALLERSPVRAEPGIRETILSENRDLVDLDERRFLFILDFQKRRLQPQEPVIDPVAEAQRLRAQGAAAGSGAAGGVVAERTGSQPLPPGAE